MDWDEYFLEICDVVAKKSKDTTKIGAIIVNPRTKNILSTGYNWLPKGIEPCDDNTSRPDKYKYMVHAEMNCVNHAARLGPPVEGMTLYLNYSAYNICSNCAKNLINAGISHVKGNSQNRLDTHWDDDLEFAQEMFTKARIVVEDI